MVPKHPENLRSTADTIRSVRSGMPHDLLGIHHIETCNEAAEELEALREEVAILRACRDALATLCRLEIDRGAGIEDDAYRDGHVKAIAQSKQLLEKLGVAPSKQGPPHAVAPVAMRTRRGPKGLGMKLTVTDERALTEAAPSPNSDLAALHDSMTPLFDKTGSAR